MTKPRMGIPRPSAEYERMRRRRNKDYLKKRMAEHIVEYDISQEEINEILVDAMLLKLLKEG